jgi:hypothetical protein
MRACFGHSWSIGLLTAIGPEIMQKITPAARAREVQRGCIQAKA